MKKILQLITISIILIFLFGCVSNKEYSNNQDSRINDLNLILQQKEMNGNETKIYFSVENDLNELMDQFNQGNFELIYNGKSIPFTLSLAKDETISVGLVIDRSNSMIWNKSSSPLPINEQPLTYAKSSAKEFVSNLKIQDRAALIAFAGTSLVLSGYTSSKNNLNKKIDSISANSSTALYDGIYEALSLSSNEEGRKALILLSDGANNSGEFNKRDVLTLASENKIPIYTIGYSTMDGTGYERDLLMELSNQTGGKFYENVTNENISSIYKNISTNLEKQYYLIFTLPDGIITSDTNQDIKLKIKYKNSNGSITDEIQLN